MRVLVLLAWCCSLAIAADALPDLAAERSAWHQATTLAEQQSCAAALQQRWQTVEAPWRDRDRAAYAAIEVALGDLGYAVQSGDAATAAAAIAELDRLLGGDTAVATASTTITDLRGFRDAVLATARDPRPEAIRRLRQAWPQVESAVASRDPAAYLQVESLLAEAAATREPSTLGRLADTLAPFTAASAYGAWDAGLLLLREGVEALLVVTALLAITRRSGAPRATAPVWWGAGAGIALSIALAAGVAAVAGAALSGSGRELVEGLVGLAAAATLVWVSWWLHRGAAMRAWAAAVADRTSAALAGGGGWALAAVAFLAVLREGAETALFLLGMAGSISGTDLALGLGCATAALGALAVVMLGLGARLPLKPLLRGLGWLLAFMAVKFAGAGVAAMQVALWLPEHRLAWLPALPTLGLFPTVEAIAAQLLVIAAIAALHLIAARERQDAPCPA